MRDFFMYNLEQAQQIVKEKHLTDSESYLVINQDDIIEEDFGWTFYFTTEEQIQANKNEIPHPGMIGAGPIFFDKKNGISSIGASGYSYILNRDIFEWEFLNRVYIWNLDFDNNSLAKSKLHYISLVKKYFNLNTKGALDVINSKLKMDSYDKIVSWHYISAELNSLGFNNKIKKVKIT